MKTAISFFRNILAGIVVIGILTILSFYIAHTKSIQNLHLSVLIIGILLGVLCSPIFSKNKQILECGVSFSAKKVLRLGIILFGFNVPLAGIIEIGFKGVFIAFAVVCVIFALGSFIGIKILKLDKQTSLLVSVGSAVCGAAAVLALEGVLKSESSKGILAVASVVIFGLIGMFLFPIVLNMNLIPFDDAQKGLFLGAALHEVANVVGASGAIISANNHIVQEYAIIVKMIRVILLVPLLLLVAFFINKESKTNSIYIPWFAIFFLLAIIFTSIVKLSPEVLNAIKIASQISLTFAMIALGLQIDFHKIRQMGFKVLILSIALFIFLAILSFIITINL